MATFFKASIPGLILSLTTVSAETRPVRKIFPEPDVIPNRLIIKFQANDVFHQQGIADVGAAKAQIQQEIRANKVKKFSATQIELWETHADVKAIVARYENDPRIQYVEPDYAINIEETIDEQVDIMPNDAFFDKLWGLRNTGQCGGVSNADIKGPEAWSIKSTCDEVIIAVIDTGVDYNHIDLKNNMWRNPNEIPDNGQDDDGNGYIDDVYGWDFAYGDNDPADGQSHGTHVAGIIAAQGNNSEGVTGVCWSAKIMALKSLSDSGFGSTSKAIEAIEYALEMGAHITNNSWGSRSYSQALHDAIALAEQQGQLFVASAGNYGENTDQRPYYPASFPLENIISVAATDHNDYLAAFSNYGATSVDLAAPGAEIYSTMPYNGYGFKSGTSMAAPYVSGVAALVWSRLQVSTAAEVKQYILETVDQLDALTSKMTTQGRLNVYKALPNKEPQGIILDSTLDGSPWIRIRGEWQDSTEPSGYYGQDYLHDLNSSTTTRKMVQFTPEILQEGIYRIYLRYPASSLNTTRALVLIKDQYGDAYRSIDQQNGGDKWTSVGGYFYFKPGMNAYRGSVKILNNGANGRVIADAVLFEAVDDIMPFSTDEEMRAFLEEINKDYNSQTNRLLFNY